MSDYRRFPIQTINTHLICVLCSGYLIDATTIVECLHTFCKSCIVRYFESSKFCPICDVQVHKSEPLLSLRPDEVLQKLVYKLAPKIHHKEMLRRKKYYVTNTKFRPVSLDDAGCDINRNYVLPEDVVCLALKSISENKKANEEENTRFFKCSTNINICQLIKLIKGKFDLPPEHPVSIYTDQSELLPTSISLVDVAYMIGWKRKQLMVLYYKIFFSKKIKFEPAISLRPGKADSKKQLARNQINAKPDSKHVSVEVNPKKQLAKIAPALPRKESRRAPSSCVNKLACSVPPEISIPAYKTVLPYATPPDITSLNPYAISQPDPLTNNYGLSLLPLCSPAVPTVLSNNIINSFALGGSVLPMGISLGTNLFCPSMTNPVINQNITNIELSSVPAATHSVLPSTSQTSVVNSIQSLPISSTKTEQEINIRDSPVKASLEDREVQLTISETGVASFKSYDTASDFKALIKPIVPETCELLTQIETNHLIDSEDSKESDVTESCGKLSQIKQEISLIIDNLMDTTDQTVVRPEQFLKDKKILASIVPVDSTPKSLVKNTLKLDLKNDTSLTTPSDAILKEKIKEANTCMEQSTAKKMGLLKVTRPTVSQIVKCKTDVNKFKSKKGQPAGYKTLKSSPRGWNPMIHREQILKNSKKDRTANKFFKCRNISLPSNSYYTMEGKSDVIQSSKTSPKVSTSKQVLYNDKSPFKEDSPKAILVTELPRVMDKATEKVSKDIHQGGTNNLALEGHLRKHSSFEDNLERNTSNNNNTIDTCCLENKFKIPINKAPNSKEIVIHSQSQISAAKINDSKTDNIAKISPILVNDRPKNKTKPYEENKRKSSMPKKTIRRSSSQNSATSRNKSPDIRKVISPPKDSPKSTDSLSVKVTPSVDAFKNLHALQTLSSLFPNAGLNEAYQACLPLNLNGFDKFGFNSAFPQGDLTSSAQYMSGLCDNMFQRLLMQANGTVSPQDAISLLAGQDSLNSNLLNMNFSNSPFLSNSFMGLPGTSSQSHSTEGSLVTPWLRSQENRHSLLSSSAATLSSVSNSAATLSPVSNSAAKLSPVSNSATKVSPATTTTSATISPVSYSSDAKLKRISVGMKDKVFHKPTNPAVKEAVGSAKIVISCETPSESSITLGTQGKPTSTASITFSSDSHSKQLPTRALNCDRQEKNNNLLDANITCIRKDKISELTKKTENPKDILNVVSTKVDYQNTHTNSKKADCNITKSSVSHKQELAANIINKCSQTDKMAVTNAEKPIPININSELKSCTIQSNENVMVPISTKSNTSIGISLPSEERNLEQPSVLEVVTTTKTSPVCHQTIVNDVKFPELITNKCDVSMDTEKVNYKISVDEQYPERKVTCNDTSCLAKTKVTASNSKPTTCAPISVKENISLETASNKPLHLNPNTNSQKGIDISTDISNVLVNNFCPPITSLEPDSIEIKLAKVRDLLEHDAKAAPKSTENIPNNLPICSTPKKVTETPEENSIITADTFDLKENSLRLDTTNDIENESFSNSETSLPLVMDEAVFDSSVTSPILKSNISGDIQTSLDITSESKLSALDKSESSLAPTFLMDSPLSGLNDQGAEGCFQLTNTLERDKQKITNSDQFTTDKCNALNTDTFLSTSQSDPISLLNEVISKKDNECQTPTFSKTSSQSNNSYSEKKSTEQKHVTLHNKKTDNKVQQSPYKAPTKNQTMSNYSSTDEFLQQLQSMTSPQSCATQRVNSAQQDSWSNNFLSSNNNAAYSYACQKPCPTAADTTCNQQYSFRSSTASSKTPTQKAQFSYNNNYEQQKVQCSEASNAKKASTSHENYSSMQGQPATNQKYNYPLHPFSNSGYNANYANFLSNNTTQSSNLSSLMSGAGYNFNFPNPKMFSGQQSYFSLNQGSANNYISGTYGSNSGSNYQNSMNQYGFSNSNMNSNFGNNFGGSLSNFHFPYYNYNSYSHLYPGENVGLMSHHASSLMPSFPVSSRGSLSPRNTSTPQSFNDLPFQSSLFPVVPFVSGLQGSAGNNASSLGNTHGGGIHPPKYPPRSSVTPKSTQKGASKSRKVNSQGTKAAQDKTKTPITEIKGGDHFTPSGAMPCSSSFSNSTTVSTNDIDKANKTQYAASNHLKTSDGSIAKSSHQIDPKNPYNMDPHSRASMSYPHGSNSIPFDPAASSTPKPNNKQQFPTDFPSLGDMYNAHINPNCNVGNFQ